VIRRLVIVLVGGFIAPLTTLNVLCRSRLDSLSSGAPYACHLRHRRADGNPALVHQRRWRYQDILVRRGEALVGGEWTIANMAVVEQLDAIASIVERSGIGRPPGGRLLYCRQHSRSAERTRRTRRTILRTQRRIGRLIEVRAAGRPAAQPLNARRRG
jgi:hypothetical protein